MIKRMTLIDPLVEFEHPPISSTMINTILQRAGHALISATSNPEVAPKATVCEMAVPKAPSRDSLVPVKYRDNAIMNDEAARI